MVPGIHGPSDSRDTRDTPQILWTAEDLMAAEFSAPRWAVPGVIAEGVTVLAGPPKVGKSWLFLGLAVAVAAGGRALGSIPVRAGPVLYMALEDTPRRLQSRLRTVLADAPAPDRLTLLLSCPPLPEGGEWIDRWLTINPDARLVIIDVYARLRGPTPPGVSAYDADYSSLGRIKAIADAHGVAIVLIHHVRKAQSEDYLNDLNGTNGLSGAADTVAVLRRPRGEGAGTLYVTGRDVDETELSLSFDAEHGLWSLLAGSAIEHTLSGTRLQVWRYVQAHDGAGPAEIAEAIGASEASVRQTVRRMTEAAQLDVIDRGRYCVPGTPSAPPLT
jgi:hypothetical protein